MLCHALGREIICLSLQHFIAPDLDSMPCPPDKGGWHHAYRLFPYFKWKSIIFEKGRSFLSETEMASVLSAKKWPTGVCEIECAVSVKILYECSYSPGVCKLWFWGIYRQSPWKILFGYFLGLNLLIFFVNYFYLLNKCSMLMAMVWF